MDHYSSHIIAGELKQKLCITPIRRQPKHNQWNSNNYLESVGIDTIGSLDSDKPWLPKKKKGTRKDRRDQVNNHHHHNSDLEHISDANSYLMKQ